MRDWDQRSCLLAVCSVAAVLILIGAVAPRVWTSSIDQATLYDVDAEIIGVGYSYTNPYDLRPGQTASFDVEVYFWKGKPNRSTVGWHFLQVFDDWGYGQAR
jgi:hypothetical protein